MPAVRILGAGWLLASTMLVTPALAQQPSESSQAQREAADDGRSDAAASSGARPSDRQQQNNDIVVTGLRPDAYRTEQAGVGVLDDTPLIDTPRTISVFTKDFAADIQAADFYDIIKFDAALRPLDSRQSIQQQTAIRGIPSNVTTNYRRDGLTTRSAVEPIEQVERLEVLKGVSGILFGFGTPSGIVNFVSKMPMNEPLTEGTVSVDGFGGHREHIDVSRRFGQAGTFGLRANLAYEDYEFRDDRTGGDRVVLALAGDVRVAEGLTVSLNGYHLENSLERNDRGFFPVYGGRIIEPDYDTWYGQDWTYSRLNSDVASARVSHEGGGWRVDVRAQILDFKLKEISDTTPAAAQVNGNYNINKAFTIQDEMAFSGRILVSKQFRTGGISHTLTIGGNLSDMDRDVSGINVAAGVANIFSRNQLPDPGGAFLPARPSLRFDYNSIVVSDRVSFGDLLDIHLGARRNFIRQRSYSYASGALVTEYKRAKTAPSVAAVLKPTERTSIYIGYDKALEPGGIAPTTAKNANEVLPPAISEQLEIGGKAEIGRNLLVTASVFQTDRPSAFVNAQNIFALDGRERYRGVELSVTGSPVPWLQLVGSALLLEPKIRRSATPALVGKSPQGAAEIAGSLFAIASVTPRLALTGGVQAVDRRPVTLDNSVTVPGFARFDLGARYMVQVGPSLLTLRASVDNVTDKFYWQSVGFGTPGIGEPRTFKLSLTANL